MKKAPINLFDMLFFDFFNIRKSPSNRNNVIVTVDENACEGDELTVNVIYDYPISMPFIGTIIGSQQITLNASVTDTILQPVCP